MILSFGIRWMLLLLIFSCDKVLPKIYLRRAVVCSKNNVTQLFLNVTTEKKKQYINFDVTLKQPLDESVGLTADLETSLNGKTYIPLLSIHEKEFCKACNTFLGEMWYDIERAAQVIPGACPVLARRYYVHHHLMDFDKMTLQALPFGKIRSTINAIDNKSKNRRSLFCILVEVENLGD